MTVKLKAESSDERMRVAFSSWLGDLSKNNGGTEQFNYLVVPMKDLERDINLDLRKFSTAEWWLAQFDPPAEYTSPYLEEVRGVGFETGAAHHESELERVELRGRFISGPEKQNSLL